MLSKLLYDWNQILQNDRDHKVLFMGGPNKLKMTDDPILKNRKIAISVQLIGQFD